jgi:hypothetical protein
LQGIDHVVIAIGDLDRAAADFRRLGFTLTPRGRHTMGSENHCAMFANDYFELLAVPAEHPVTRYYSDFLRHGDGLAALALKTDDADAFHAELRAAGIRVDPPVDFSRPVALPEGPRDAAFRIAQVDIAETPGGRTFVCQHFTRDVVWRPEYLAHANGAVGLQRIGVLTDAARFGEVRAAYERLFDRAGEGRGNGGGDWEVATGDTPIHVSTRPQPARAQPGAGAARPLPFFAELGFRVRSIEETRRILDEAKIHSVREGDGSLKVVSPLTHGVFISFTEAGA